VSNPLTFVPWCATAGIAEEFRSWAAPTTAAEEADSVVECMKIWRASHQHVIGLRPACSFRAEAMPARHICTLQLTRQSRARDVAACSRVPQMLSSIDECGGNYKHGTLSWAALRRKDATVAAEVFELALQLGYTFASP